MTTYEAIRKSGPNGVARNTLITGGKLFVSNNTCNDLRELKRMRFVREYTHGNGLIMCVAA